MLKGLKERIAQGQKEADAALAKSLADLAAVQDLAARVRRLAS